MNHYKIAVVCLSSFLWACSTKPTVTAPVTDPTTPSSINTSTGKSDNTVNRSSALNSLLSLAEQQESQGNLQGATRTLERAIRISPRTPEVYLKLAELNYRQGKNAQAESFAEKALSFNPNDMITEQAELLLEKLKLR
ncbi:tetratricopeptide repeat protein [Psychromonas sp. 14N.309.X.WAT.B.A12]|jgi:Tfp pilus assembly protein PilF|uniref:tetratricopeptide repeat protein n=1 Tax=unclassified Psychromonas TaxID=2614957 RepID=UPI0025B12421|nr:tetratricopeptide repeat protein [Psychromonas sp. 14N.309.X.WAT.B.A12]MDN2662683.1 tetratricopeptide repeat protein [Psychromonas sp. 14N.309.X.WAT.B.A12]